MSIVHSHQAHGGRWENLVHGFGAEPGGVYLKRSNLSFYRIDSQPRRRVASPVR